MFRLYDNDNIRPWLCHFCVWCYLLFFLFYVENRYYNTNLFSFPQVFAVVLRSWWTEFFGMPCVIIHFSSYVYVSVANTIMKYGNCWEFEASFCRHKYGCTQWAIATKSIVRYRNPILKICSKYLFLRLSFNFLHSSAMRMRAKTCGVTISSSIFMTRTVIFIRKIKSWIDLILFPAFSQKIGMYFAYWSKTWALVVFSSPYHFPRFRYLFRDFQGFYSVKIFLKKGSLNSGRYLSFINVHNAKCSPLS